jgi:hypothetical protein
MADEPRDNQSKETNWVAEADSLPQDAGGTPARGYSADPEPAPPVPADGPLPLVPDSKVGSVHVPERDEHVHPTGRQDPDKSPAQIV